MFKSLVREDESTSNSNNLQSKKDGSQRQFSEEKNKFALSVLRRVRVKLEGREPDSLRKVRIIVFKEALLRVLRSCSNKICKLNLWSFKEFEFED